MNVVSVRSRPRRRMENGLINAKDCPDRAELTGFATGNLSVEAFQHVARHVEQCSVCEKTLAALDADPDPFLSRLRRQALQHAPAEEPVPRELLAAAQSCYRE